MKLLERLRLENHIKNMAATIPTGKSNSQLKKELEEVREQLNSILTKWKWNNKTPKTSQEFLNKFTPWVDKKIKEEEELKEFLKRKGVNSLSEIE